VALLPATPAQRREQIQHQVGLANALYHTNGFAAAETKAAFDKARLMIEQAERLGEHIEDPLLLYSVLYGFFIAKFIVFDGDAACALARQFLALAEQQKVTAPIMIGHRLLANTLLCMGDAAEGLSHLDRALALYDPAVHRPRHALPVKQTCLNAPHATYLALLAAVVGKPEPEFQSALDRLTLLAIGSPSKPTCVADGTGLTGSGRQKK
jgi:hypothetical protein